MYNLIYFSDSQAHNKYVTSVVGGGGWGGKDMSDKRFNSVVWISVRTHFPDFENSKMKLSRNLTSFDSFKVVHYFLIWKIFNIKLDIKTTNN